MSKINNQDDSFLKLRDIEVVFRVKGKKLQAVKETTLDIQQGEIFGLVGESGSGKTTIGRAIVGVQELQDGAIYLENRLVAGKPSSLYTLNKEISKKLHSMKIKMNSTTIYINQFILELKKFYEANKNSDSINKEEFLKKVNVNKVEFIDDIFLSNLKYINRIIKNQERIIRFISNLHKTIDKVSLKLEQAILTKQKQVNSIVFELKEILDLIYETWSEVFNWLNEKTEKVYDLKDIFVKILNKLSIIVQNHKKFLEILENSYSFQFENEALCAPLQKREKFIQYYYNKIYIKRDEFYEECLKELEEVKTLPNYEQTNEYKKLQKFMNDFWSKKTMNLSTSYKVLEELHDQNPNYEKLNSLVEKLDQTDFENKLKDLVNQKKVLSDIEFNELKKELNYIKQIINKNIIKDEEVILHYRKRKNIEFSLTKEEVENIEEFIEFLELPSIDQIVKKSYIFKSQSKAQKRENRRNIQMIFQDPGSSLNDRMAVEEIISEGLNNFPELYKDIEVREKYLEHYNSQEHAIKKTIDEVKDEEVKKYLVLNALTSVGLIPEHLSRYPHEFSGGQRQRIGIARSLIMRPKLIVADEPISALDVSIRAQVLNLFKKFKEELGITFVFVAHDLSVVRFIADRIAVIYHGQIVEMAEADELFINPLHPYTRSLLSSIPVPDPELAKTKQAIVYNPDEEHKDYIFDLPKFVEVKKDHFVFANKRELKEIKKT